MMKYAQKSLEIMLQTQIDVNEWILRSPEIKWNLERCTLKLNELLQGEL